MRGDNMLNKFMSIMLNIEDVAKDLKESVAGSDVVMQDVVAPVLGALGYSGTVSFEEDEDLESLYTDFDDSLCLVVCPRLAMIGERVAMYNECVQAHMPSEKGSILAVTDGVVCQFFMQLVDGQKVDLYSFMHIDFTDLHKMDLLFLSYFQCGSSVCDVLIKEVATRRIGSKMVPVWEPLYKKLVKE